MIDRISVVKSNRKINYLPKDEIINGDENIKKMLKSSLELLKLDEENIGTKKWNPFKEFIKENDTVLIKPNLVLEKNQGEFGEECLFTNPFIVREIIEYCILALNRTGKIIVADAPVQQCNFEKLIENSGYKKMIKYYQEKGIKIELMDLRGLKSYKRNGSLIQEINKNVHGKVIDLKHNSEHYNEFSTNYRITNYPTAELLKHHNNDKHEYFISDTLLQADVVINVPKPKSHRKAGITLGMKNFVGVNVRKEYLPHHKFGSKIKGGDEYLSNSPLLTLSSKLIDKKNDCLGEKKYFLAKYFSTISRVLSGIDKRFLSKEKNREGSWYGNDTIWRTVADINKIIAFSDKNGNLCKNRQRIVFNVADMIIVGEKEGPLLPTPKYCGYIVCGEDILQFDLVCGTLLGIDVNKVPLYDNIRNIKNYKFFNNKEYIIYSNNKKINGRKYNEISKSETAQIEPSSGWKGHIEL